MKIKLINMMKSQPILLGAILASSILFNPYINAYAGEEHQAKIEIPATAEAIWQSIDEESQELSKVIEAGKWDEVHHHAFAIRDFVAALPSHSNSLPAKKLAKVKANGKFVAILAERLDMSGDAKDKSSTESNFKKLQRVLRAIRKNY
ncbi:MAG: hypothetical protein Q9M14_00120 [Mariprofundaceae bacterium]|nr:hypothetical protein [Mariprofundaceae bacterium]